MTRNLPAVAHDVGRALVRRQSVVERLLLSGEAVVGLVAERLRQVDQFLDDL